jgi:hypothetical protein
VQTYTFYFELFPHFIKYRSLLFGKHEASQRVTQHSLWSVRLQMKLDFCSIRGSNACNLKCGGVLQLPILKRRRMASVRCCWLGFRLVIQQPGTWNDKGDSQLHYEEGQDTMCMRALG